MKRTNFELNELESKIVVAMENPKKQPPQKANA